MKETETMPRLGYGALGVVTIALGLTARFAPLGLPWVVRKWAGSTLWAVMIYWLLALVWPKARPVWLLVAAGTVATLVELSRLVPFAAVDAFRLTLPGVILLGRFFSVWDIVAYWIAIALGALLDGFLRTKGRRVA